MAAAPGDEWIDDVLPLNDMEMGMAAWRRSGCCVAATRPFRPAQARRKRQTKVDQEVCDRRELQITMANSSATAALD